MTVVDDGCGAQTAEQCLEVDHDDHVGPVTRMGEVDGFAGRGCAAALEERQEGESTKVALPSFALRSVCGDAGPEHRLQPVLQFAQQLQPGLRVELATDVDHPGVRIGPRPQAVGPLLLRQSVPAFAGSRRATSIFKVCSKCSGVDRDAISARRAPSAVRLSRCSGFKRLRARPRTSTCSADTAPASNACSSSGTSPNVPARRIAWSASRRPDLEVSARSASGGREAADAARCCNRRVSLARLASCHPRTRPSASSSATTASRSRTDSSDRASDDTIDSSSAGSKVAAELMRCTVQKGCDSRTTSELAAPTQRSSASRSALVPATTCALSTCALPTDVRSDPVARTSRSSTRQCSCHSSPRSSLSSTSAARLRTAGRSLNARIAASGRAIRWFPRRAAALRARKSQ